MELVEMELRELLSFYKCACAQGLGSATPSPRPRLGPACAPLHAGPPAVSGSLWPARQRELLSFYKCACRLGPAGRSVHCSPQAVAESL